MMKSIRGGGVSLAWGGFDYRFDNTIFMSFCKNQNILSQNYNGIEITCLYGLGGYAVNKPRYKFCIGGSIGVNMMGYSKYIGERCVCGFHNINEISRGECLYHTSVYDNTYNKVKFACGLYLKNIIMVSNNFGFVFTTQVAYNAAHTAHIGIVFNC